MSNSLECPICKEPLMQVALVYVITKAFESCINKETLQQDSMIISRVESDPANFFCYKHGTILNIAEQLSES